MTDFEMFRKTNFFDFRREIRENKFMSFLMQFIFPFLP